VAQVIKLDHSVSQQTREGGWKIIRLFAAVIKQIFITRLNLIMKIDLKIKWNFLSIVFFHSFLSLKFRPISDLQIAAEIKISDLGITRKKICVTK
jgi:hypothetical protein